MNYRFRRSFTGGGYKLIFLLLVLLTVLTSCRNTVLPPWVFIPQVQTTKYTVSFEMSNQDPYPEDVTLPGNYKVKEGKTITQPENPDAGEEWVFAGWSISADENISFDFSLPVFQDTTLYAFFVSKDEPVTDDPSLPEGTQATFDDDTGGYEITSFGEHSDEPKDIVIPSEINGVPVTAIGRRAFMGRQDINSITIPSSVKEIGSQTFTNSSVSKLILNEGIETIGMSAFYNTDIAATESNPLVLPDSLTSIGTAAFGSSPNIEKVVFGANITKIGDRAFENSGLTGELIIPATVTEIGQGAFQNSDSITKLIFEDGIQLEEIGWNAFSNCENLESVSLKGVSKISNSAFSACPNLTTVEATGVEAIMDRAFEGCTELSEVTNLDSVKELNSRAFQDCKNINSIEFSSSDITIKANTGSEYGGVWAGVFEGWTADQTIIFSGISAEPADWPDVWDAYCDAAIKWADN